MSLGVTSRLRLLPEEILEMVVEELEETEDILNLFKAYPRLGALLQKKKGAWLFDQALPSLLPFMKLNEILACRQTCRRWHRAIEPVHPIPSPTDDAKRKLEWFGKMEWSPEHNGNEIMKGPILAKMTSFAGNDMEEPSLLHGDKWPKELKLQFIAKKSPLWKSLEPDELYGNQNTVVISFQDLTVASSLARLLDSQDWGGVIRFTGSDPDMLWSCGNIRVTHNPEQNTFYGAIPDKHDLARLLMREQLLALLGNGLLGGNYDFIDLMDD